MSDYKHEVTAGNPNGRAFVRAGVAEDGRLWAELYHHGKPFPRHISAMIAQAFADLMLEGISELPDPESAKRAVGVADQAIRKAQDASTSGNGKSLK